eukprot:m.74746 g.74746  ORF g.74746 m.74746 type:complete len:225 (-) comp13946_c0_seq3:241-915(-)
MPTEQPARKASKLEMACEGFARIMWTILVLLSVLVLTVAFGTSYWVETKSTALALGYDKISLGLIYACLQRVGHDEICGQYGHGLQDVPITTWRSAAFFYATGMFFGWVTFILAVSSFFWTAAKPALCHMMMATFSLIVFGLFLFGASLGELKYSKTSRIFEPCQGAKAFNTGSSCKFSDSGIIACIGMGLSFIAASTGYLLDKSIPPKGQQEEQEASARKLSS